MGMDYFQYQVPRFWYRFYWAIMLAFNLLIVGFYVSTHYVPELGSYADTFALTNTALVMSGINLVYLLAIYWSVARYSLPFATLIGYLLFSAVALYGMSQTSMQSGSYLYIAVWVVAMFLNGAYGLLVLVGAAFLTMMYAALQSNFQFAELSTPSMALLAGSVVASAAAYFFWRTRYISVQDQKVTQLSGMLRSNQQQSEILIRSIADGIIVTNTEGKITLINPAAAALTEWSVEEATGLDVQLVAKLHKEDGSEIAAEENPFALVLGQEKYINQALQITGRRGKKLVISLVASPVIVPGTKAPVGAVAAIRDISEQRAAEKQRAEFISTASHEMRTPVAAIEGYLSLALSEKVSTVDNRAKGYLEKAHSSTQRLGKLFQDLLTSSKAEDGRLNNHPAVVEMGAFMQQLTDDLKFAAEKKGLFAEFIVGDGGATIDATAKDVNAQHLIKPLYYAYVDPDRMREVITNLFDNACKYTDTGKISIGLTGNTDLVQLYLRDTGAGIPTDDIPHLFQKFYRVDSSATRTIGGTGLGLFICRKIVELYRGRIWVESQIGKGSTFFINLPRLSNQRAMELQVPESARSTAAIVNPTTSTNP